MDKQKIVAVRGGELFPGQGGKIVIEFRLPPGTDYVVPYPNSWELKSENSILTTFPDSSEGVISREKGALIPFIRSLEDKSIGDHTEIVIAHAAFRGANGGNNDQETVEFHIHFVLKNDEHRSGISKDSLDIHIIHQWQ